MNSKEEKFQDQAQRRGIEFAKIGMRVSVNGKMGTIKSMNNHLNLDVVFDGQKHKSNCHPHWMTKYYDNEGNIIKEFNS